MTAVAEALGTPVLEVVGIRVRFGGLMALDGVSLNVGAASLTGLVGPNGAGKSTLFGVCSGLIKPSGGRVLLKGREVTDASPRACARLGLARTFQQPELFIGLTVRQHLTLAYRASHARRRLLTDMFTGASLRRPPSDEVERVDSLLELLSLTGVAEHVVDVLPLGATRLVEVGRALAASPSMVLLDEPLSGLDANESAHLADALVKVVCEEQISLLLVEHDVATVLRLCGHIYVLDFGTVIADGDAATIRGDAAVRSAYLGDDPYGQSSNGV